MNEEVRVATSGVRKIYGMQNAGAVAWGLFFLAGFVVYGGGVSKLLCSRLDSK